MQAKPGVVDLLNAILTNELTAINQYFLHAEMCQSWGYSRLYSQFRAFSIEEMKDAEELIQHILYLDGVPNVQRMGQVMVGETAQEQLELTLRQEYLAIDKLREAIGHCTEQGDYTTRGKLESMISDEEEHVDWLETQVETIRQVGVENYLSQQLHG